MLDMLRYWIYKIISKQRNMFPLFFCVFFTCFKLFWLHEGCAIVSGITGLILFSCSFRSNKFFVPTWRMRRSGAPSQLSGNAMKKPRFVPPSASGFVPEPMPLMPKSVPCNAVDKASFYQQYQQFDLYPYKLISFFFLNPHCAHLFFFSRFADPEKHFNTNCD